MTLALPSMSQDEIERADWMLRIHGRRATQAQVAAHLALSVRQVEPLETRSAALAVVGWAVACRYEMKAARGALEGPTRLA